jgi:hypothetical protein
MPARAARLATPARAGKRERSRATRVACREPLAKQGWEVERSPPRARVRTRRRVPSADRHCHPTPAGKRSVDLPRIWRPAVAVGAVGWVLWDAFLTLRGTLTTSSGLRLRTHREWPAWCRTPSFGRRSARRMTHAPLRSRARDRSAATLPVAVTTATLPILVSAPSPIHGPLSARTVSGPISVPAAAGSRTTQATRSLDAQPRGPRVAGPGRGPVYR